MSFHKKYKAISMSRALCALVSILLLCSAARAQNASPLGGVGSLQFFDNLGNLLSNGVVYVYQAGTSTQATVYTDSTGTTTQPNPVTFGSGARASIWLANGTFVKVVLCVQNDGAFCAGNDVFFSADQVPIGASSSGGGGSPFTGIFISSTATPATSGVLRLASGDSICWRNAAGSANPCFKKDANDLLSWDGGSLKLPEVAAPAGIAGFDILWADNTAHRLKAVNNAGTAAQYVLSGNDIGTTDNVTALHFGATQQSLSGTAPTTGQELQWNGTNIVGNGPIDVPVGWCVLGAACFATSAFNETTNSAFGNEVFFPAAHTLVRFTYILFQSAVTCSTSPVISVKDFTSSTVLASATLSNGATIGFTDSGALSVATTAGHKIVVGVSTASVGCGTQPTVINVNAVFE